MKKFIRLLFSLNGGWWETRTPDPLLVRQMLSPSELITHYCSQRKKNGTRDRARTCDLRLRRALLFQLSYSCEEYILALQFIFSKLNINVLAATYSHTSTRCTTIGTSWLNFCVRNGNRCTSTVITTKTLTSNFYKNMLIL